MVETVVEEKPGEEPKANDRDTGAEGEEQNAAPETPTDPFTPDVLARAAPLFSEEEARSFGTPEGLNAGVMALQRRLATLAPPTTETPKPATAAPASETAEFDWGTALDGYDDDLKQAIMGSHKHAMAASGNRVKALEDEMKELKNTAGDAAKRRVTNELDAFVADLGEEWEPIFGKGDIFSIPKGSTGWVARNRLGEQMYALAMGYDAAGIPVPSPAELRKVALQTGFTAEAKGIAQRKASPTQTIARPTQRKGRELPIGRERAIARAKETDVKVDKARQATKAREAERVRQESA